MEAKAIVRHLRIAPRKVRLVVDEINKDSFSKAITKLKFIKKSAAPHVLKVIKSAIANATKNHGADADALRIKNIKVDQGPILKNAKRFIPRAMGRATPIHKRSSHVTVIVTDEKIKKGKK